MFLHEHPKFKDLIETIAFERKFPLTIVEKDYWVMHALWGLVEGGFTYYFKGRFKEDADKLADLPAFKLDDTKRVAALTKAHETEKGLYFEPQPDFGEIKDFFREKIPGLQIQN